MLRTNCAASAGYAVRACSLAVMVVALTSLSSVHAAETLHAGNCQGRSIQGRSSCVVPRPVNHRRVAGSGGLRRALPW